LFISSQRAKAGCNPQVVNELADCRQATFLKLSAPAIARNWTVSQRHGKVLLAPALALAWQLSRQDVRQMQVVALALNMRRERLQWEAG